MLMSKAEYARHRGVSRQTVYDWIKKGELVMVGSKIDVEASEAGKSGNRRNRQKVAEPDIRNDLGRVLGSHKSG
jgi:predicted site-specific integrase-resolvase